MNKYPTGLNPNRFIHCLVLLGLHRQDPTNLRSRIQNGIIYLDRPIAEVAATIVDRFIPESILTPHNKSGGFCAGSKGVSNVKHVQTMRDSQCDRFATLRSAINRIDRALAHTGYDPADPGESGKDEFVSILFATGDFRLKTWLDVVYAQTDLGLKALPIAGKAGAEGSGEYSKSYADALFAEYSSDGEPLDHCLRDLQSLLSGTNAATYQKISPGRFTAAGGIGTQFGVGTSVPRINPWELLLAMSGVMFFASLPHRHTDGTDSSSPTIPFSVAASQLGYASASQSEKAGCEIFFPHWDVMVSGQQLQDFFRKGRSRIDDRPAKTGLKFLTAIAHWSPSAAIPRFSRFLALERASDRGNAWFCYQGTYEPMSQSDANLVSQAQSWVNGYCRDTQTQALASRYYGVVGGTERITDLAIALGRSFLSRRSSAKLSKLALPKLSSDWISRLVSENPNSRELRLALALRHYSREHPSSRDSDPLHYWVSSNLTQALIAVNRDRAKYWSQHPKPVAVPRIHARCDDLAAFLLGDTNDALILDFVRFFSVAAVDSTVDLGWAVPDGLPAGFRAIAAVWHWCKLWRPDRRDRVTFPYEGQILTGLTSGNATTSTNIALRRLRQADHLDQKIHLLRHGFDLPIATSQRWAAAIGFSLSDSTIASLVCKHPRRAIAATAPIPEPEPPITSEPDPASPLSPVQLSLI